MNPKLTNEHLERAAIVYIRQSTPHQVRHHLEGQRLQYALQDRARQLGFQRVTVIDDDQGHSALGLVNRGGFDQLLSAVSTEAVGAIFCLEASRLARNGREWQHLIEFCGITGTLIADAEAIYDPALSDDRLLLGIKGTMAEFESNLFRQRSAAAIRQMAQRGALQFSLPVGYVWAAADRIEKEADQRVQHALALVFAKMTELPSVRQVLLWFHREDISLPRKSQDQPGLTVWARPTYSALLSLLSNPIYGGAYAYGRTQTRTRVIEGRARKTVGHKKPRAEWTALILEHHPGYISWEQYERNQAKMADNVHMKSRAEPKAGRGGRALLSGMLRCGRCGRMLYVSYSGSQGMVLRYQCRGAHMNQGEPRCITFSGRGVERAVAGEVLRAIGGNAVEAAVEAAEKMREQLREQRQAVELEREQARYEARLAARRYEAVDPEQRLVAAELEARWNTALQKVEALDARLRDFDDGGEAQTIPDKEILLSLAQDLPTVWNAADAGLKQRIVRILVEELVVNVDETKQDIVVLIHWAGGRHSELRVSKRGTGQHGQSTGVEANAVIRRMAGRFGDGEIAATLNRLRLRTGAGNSWNAQRVYGVRRQQGLPSAVSNPEHQTLTLQQAVERSGVSELSLRRLIEQKVLPARQVVPCAPWEISLEDLNAPAVQQAMQSIRKRQRPSTSQGEKSDLLFSES
ncbi:MAG TPA: recombinase family protein [Bryobacteraceae bacterium]|jgi:DNA invertase Pin-like site-specific DNA recombinase|nr:recombinase family protein [Bryobacteraceae bacterium]